MDSTRTPQFNTNQRLRCTPGILAMICPGPGDSNAMHSMAGRVVRVVERVRPHEVIDPQHPAWHVEALGADLLFEEVGLRTGKTYVSLRRTRPIADASLVPLAGDDELSVLHEQCQTEEVC